MATLLRWLFRLFLGGLALAVLALVLAYSFFARSIPDYNAEWQVPGLSGPVEIVRDTYNVPHIFGPTDDDVFYALGFAHAQDRLWQMVVQRRTIQGRLSEIFGPATLETDDLMRRFDFYGLAQSSVRVQDAATRDALVAYADGVNAWIRLVNEEAMGRGGPEFFLFPPEIAPWQPADSIAMAKLMAVTLASQLDNEVLRARTSLMLAPERLADLMPDAPGTGLVALPDFATLVPGLPPIRTASLGPWIPPPLSPFAASGLSGASNAWAAAPNRAAAGGTLLASDPHLAFSAPSLWYLARLELASGGVIGGTIPGLPLVLSGRSDALGWGVTAAYVDDQDVFLEELNPDDREQYRTPGGWAEFTTRRSVIRVKDAEPVTITLRWSENGPVLPGQHFNLEAVTPPGHVAAIGWTALSGADTSVSSAMALMRARSVDEGIAAGERFIAPGLNLTLGDRERVALQTVGALPRRAARHQSFGRLPVPGWRPENRWQGRLGYSANPRVVDPESGLLGNTNNKLVDRPFPLHVSYFWGDTQRVQRWERLMTARRVHTRESFIEAQLDTVSISARTLLPLVGRELWFNAEPGPEGSPERQRQDALALLSEWNGEMNEHLPEPLIYAAWMRFLQDRLIRDELGPLADSHTHVEPLFLERVFRDVEGASAWCDVVQSTRLETCDDAARQALDEALIWLAASYGPRIEAWRWGDAHEATHDHPVLGTVRALAPIVNIRQSSSGGDQTLMRGLTRGGPGPDPFANVHGAGYRGVYDFADPDSSQFVIATGQSGHPLSRHYDDLGEFWRRGEYIPMRLDPELARAGAVGVTRLTPRPN